MTVDWSKGYPPDPLSARRIRAAIERVLAPYLAPDALADVLLAAGEAVANAIKHGGGSVEIRVEVTERSVRVCVRDSGPGFDPVKLEQARLPSPSDAESGRGLYIIRQTADRAAVTVDDGTTVEIVRDRWHGSATDAPL